MTFAPFPTLATPRLRLRAWRESDLEPFAQLNADPRVMESMPTTLDRAASDAMAARIQDRYREDGHGLWAVEAVDVAPFIGSVGLATPRFAAHFTPAVEIGWRLAAAHWGKGYATEAARAVLAFGSDVRRLREVVSFTVPANVRSRAVMARLGMTHDPEEDFDHPLLPDGHPLRRHVLYRLRP